MSRSRLVRFAAAAIALAALAGAAIIANQAPPAAASMATAADKFLATLSPEQKKKATFAYDDPHRTKWYFTPQQKDKQALRKGLRFEELDTKQKTAALELLKTGLSTTGFDQATTIMSLESVLADLEKNGANTRNPNWYFVSIFGEPSNTGKWGWRIEGHHLSVNVTLDKGQVVAATPMLFAANPADVKDGPRKGLQTLGEIEKLAKELIQSFSEEQVKVAKQAKQFPEIKEGQPSAAVGDPVGITPDKLTDEQKKTLRSLVEAYANRMPKDIALAEVQRVHAAGVEKVHFAYCIEEQKKGKPYTYRIQGPTFVVEFLNVQADSAGNPANHIHSGWRRLPIDFGLEAAR